MLPFHPVIPVCRSSNTKAAGNTHTKNTEKEASQNNIKYKRTKKKWKKQANTNIANQHCLLFIGYRVHSRMRYRFLFASISGWFSLLLFSPLPPFLCFISAGCRCRQPIALETKHTHTPTQALPIGNILFVTDATACSKQTERETHKLVSLLQHKATKHTHTHSHTDKPTRAIDDFSMVWLKSHLYLWETKTETKCAIEGVFFVFPSFFPSSTGDTVQILCAVSQTHT